WDTGWRTRVRGSLRLPARRKRPRKLDRNALTTRHSEALRFVSQIGARRPNSAPAPLELGRGTAKRRRQNRLILYANPPPPPGMDVARQLFTAEADMFGQGGLRDTIWTLRRKARGCSRSPGRDPVPRVAAPVQPREVLLELLR